jgi:cytochrome c5
MSRKIALFYAAFWLAVLVPLLAQTSTASKPTKAAEHGSSHANASDTDRGERVFQQNCSRCHNAPQDFPSQISGTILRHMRVRASLSAADEKALLRFMNP